MLNRFSRVADILAARPDLRPDLPADLEGIGRDELRAVAFGWLARPEELLDLLRHPDAPTDTVTQHDGGAAAPRRPTLGRSAVVYLHLHQAALEGTGVARVEGLGPMLRDQVRVNAYEHPEAVKERAHLITVGEAPIVGLSPYATRISRHLDRDHPVPFDSHGPPGQTGDHNIAPLGRTHHRAKTHLAYRLDQLGPGQYVWTTPHGLHRRVDHTGTHVLDDQAANTLLLGDQLDRALDRLAAAHGITLPA